MLTTVLFDYGGVLGVSGGPAMLTELLTSVFGVKSTQLNFADLHVALRCGRISTQQFLDELNSRYGSPGRTLTPEHFVGGANMLERAEPVYALARALRASGIKTGFCQTFMR